jgi:hypothetical protein
MKISVDISCLFLISRIHQLLGRDNHFEFLESHKDGDDLRNQKKNLWNSIALWSDDQLRQRMAWALSQILVVTPNQINNQEITEAYANYYDIFVRNAFGNYPMMAEMLSFLESKSSAYVLRTTGDQAYPVSVTCEFAVKTTTGASLLCLFLLRLNNETFF